MCYNLNVVTIKHVFSFVAGVQNATAKSRNRGFVAELTGLKREVRQKRDTEDGTVIRRTD